MTALLAEAREKLGQREDLANHKDIDISLQRMLAHLDPYTTYYDPETLARFRQDTNAEFSGIGVLLTGGARFDHTMANVLLLAGFDSVPIKIVDGPSVCWLVKGPGTTAIDGHVGDLLSLLPLTGDASGIRTSGLYYSLQGETLYFGKPRGVSNVLTQEHAEVSLERGLLLVIHSFFFT